MKRISRPFSRTTACSVSITGKRRQSEKRPEKLPSPNHQNPSSRLERPFYVVLYKKRPLLFRIGARSPKRPARQRDHAARIPPRGENLFPTPRRYFKSGPLRLLAVAARQAARAGRERLDGVSFRLFVEEYGLRFAVLCARDGRRFG